MKKAHSSLFKKLKSQKVQCLTCQRYCQIADGQVGFCKTRLNGVIGNYTINKKGQLYTLTYGILNGIQVDPIEKKPLYHFYPGTQVLSLGSYGCNYRCKQCLNSHCSWGQPATPILKELRRKTSVILERSDRIPNEILSVRRPTDLQNDNEIRMEKIERSMYFSKHTVIRYQIFQKLNLSVFISIYGAAQA